MTKEEAFELALQKNNPAEAHFRTIIKSIANKASSGEYSVRYNTSIIDDEILDMLKGIGYRVFKSKLNPSYGCYLYFIYWGNEISPILHNEEYMQKTLFEY